MATKLVNRGADQLMEDASGAQAVAAMQPVESGSSVITVTNASQTLAALLAAATPAAELPAGMVKAMLHNTGGVTVTRSSSGAAVAGAALPLAAGDSEGIWSTKAIADAWQMIVAAGTCTVAVRWSIPRS